MKTTLTIIATVLLAACAATADPSNSNIKRYTSNMCALTDNKLGSMGTPVTKVYGNQEVKFCCKPCVGKFEKNLEENLKDLN